MNAVLDSTRMPAQATDEAFVRFGPGGRLVGVLAGACADAGAPTLLLPSAGLQPRCGPFRLHALLAERLAERGIRSFRYDVPGIGEAPRMAACDATQATVAAMDQLAAVHGCGPFAVGGICSAADTGWDAANVDERVCALLLLDGLCFTGPWYRYAQTFERLRRLPREWRHFLLRMRGRLQGEAELASEAFRNWPEQAQAREQFARFVARDMRLLCIFSGGYADRFLHPRQFAWSFGAAALDPRVVLHYWPDCDHTYFSHAQRERLIGTVVDWMASLPRRRRP